MKYSNEEDRFMVRAFVVLLPPLTHTKFEAFTLFLWANPFQA
jgi:hypothetical protein